MLRIWVDAKQCVIHIEASSGKPFDIRVEAECWRTQRRVLDHDIDGVYGTQNAPEPIYALPDTILPAANNRIGWYHRNETSTWRFTMKHQGMEDWPARKSTLFCTALLAGLFAAPGS